MGHARLSPSGSARWLNCPGSVALSSQIQEEEKYNIYAEEGIAAHELGELCLESLEAKPQDFLGQGLNPHPVHNPEGFLVDEDMVKHIETYVEYVYSQIDIHNDYLEIEKKVKLFYSPEETGTSDVVAFDTTNNRLHIIDLKYGQGVPVSAKDNSQFLIYGISAMDELHEEGFFEVEEVVVHVVQPRINNVGSATYSREELETFRLRVLQVVEEIGKGSDEYHPGEKQCRWCPASGICEAQAKKHLATLTMSFDDLDQEPCNTELLTIDKVAEVLSQKKTIEKWLASVENICYDRLEKGLEVPGFKLVEGRSNRKWSDEEEAMKFLRGRLKKDECVTAKILSPTKAAKALGKMTTRSQNQFESLVIRPEGKPCIAPESDKRPSITKVVEQFDDLDI